MKKTREVTRRTYTIKVDAEVEWVAETRYGLDESFMNETDLKKHIMGQLFKVLGTENTELELDIQYKEVQYTEDIT